MTIALRSLKLHNMPMILARDVRARLMHSAQRNASQSPSAEKSKLDLPRTQQL